MISENDNFYLWLDGMLNPEEAAKMDARVAADPELSELAARHQELKKRLREAFDPIVEESLPRRLLHRAEKPSAPIDIVAARHQRERLFAQPAQWLAIAASLAIGLFFGGLLRPDTSPVQQDLGKLYAAASLGRSLDRQLASAPSEGAVRVGVTFRDKQGAICRSFNDEQVAGVACAGRPLATAGAVQHRRSISRGLQNGSWNGSAARRRRRFHHGRRAAQRSAGTRRPRSRLALADRAQPVFQRVLRQRTQGRVTDAIVEADPIYAIALARSIVVAQLYPPRRRPVFLDVFEGALHRPLWWLMHFCCHWQLSPILSVTASCRGA